MKLSDVLGRILTDVDLRLRNPSKGVCELFTQVLRGEGCRDGHLFSEFGRARRKFTQTDSSHFPVLGPGGSMFRIRDYDRAAAKRAMWRGAYGMNRRKFVRDMWHWAKENGL